VLSLAGHLVIVTGAASGLGAATARLLHGSGSDVVLADRNEDAGREVADQLGAGRATFVACDVTSSASIDALVAAARQRGEIRGLVHCAGSGIAAKTLDREGRPHDLDGFRAVIELNLVGSFNVLSRVAAAMATNEPRDSGERAAIVLTSSVAGFEGQIGQIAYGASKAGVIGMTIIAARDLMSHGIRVNTIAPGTMATPLFKAAPKNVVDGLAAHVPFPKRLGEPEEFAALAQHLLENGYINGEVVRIDGAIRFAPR
jgi:NAD(P)-dependent dehydrogenase (short-subunit alcohol dehydrogenase family)